MELIMLGLLIESVPDYENVGCEAVGSLPKELLEMLEQEDSSKESEDGKQHS